MTQVDTAKVAQASIEAMALLVRWRRGKTATRREMRLAMVMALLEDCADDGERAEITADVEMLFRARDQFVRAVAAGEVDVGHGGLPS